MLHAAPGRPPPLLGAVHHASSVWRVQGASRPANMRAVPCTAGWGAPGRAVCINAARALGAPSGAPVGASRRSACSDFPVRTLAALTASGPSFAYRTMVPGSRERDCRGLQAPPQAGTPLSQLALDWAAAAFAAGQHLTINWHIPTPSRSACSRCRASSNKSARPSAAVTTPSLWRFDPSREITMELPHIMPAAQTFLPHQTQGHV